jgi:hypothetical protein
MPKNGCWATMSSDGSVAKTGGLASPAELFALGEDVRYSIRQIERRELVWSEAQSFDHRLKHFTGVELGIEEHSLGHQVTTVWTLSEIAVHSGPYPRCAKEGNRRRKPGEKFQINRRVDAEPTHAK